MLSEYVGFPDKEVKVPPQLLETKRRFRTSDYRSDWSFPEFQRFHYESDSRPDEKVINAGIRFVKQIEGYIDLAIQRMISEGLISEPNPK